MMKKTYLLLISLIFTTNLLLSQVVDVVTDLEGTPDRLLLNGSDLYITQLNKDKLSKVDLSFNPPLIQDVQVDLSTPSGMALKGTELYIAVFGDNKVSKIDLSQSNPVLVDVVTGLDRPISLAFKGDDLYISQAYENRVIKIDITESLPTPVVVATGLNFPSEIIINNDIIYVSEMGADKISKIDLSKMPPITSDFITGIYGPVGLRINGDYLFVARKIDRIVSKVNITNSSPVLVDVLSSGLLGPTGIAIFEDDLYISDSYAYKILKVENIALSVESLSSDELFVYPNPCTDYLYLSSSKSEVEYNVFNISGRRLLSGSIKGNERIDITELVKGVYLLQLDEGGIQKILKK